MTPRTPSTSPDLPKWRFLQAAPREDAGHPFIRDLAGWFSRAGFGRPEVVANLAHALVRDGISMLHDTARVGGEDVAGFTRPSTTDDAIDALRRGVDDCDAKARLFVAICLAAGLGARMRPLWQGTRLAHVWAEVNLGNRWYPVETTVSHARIGDHPLTLLKQGARFNV